MATCVFVVLSAFVALATPLPGHGRGRGGSGGECSSNQDCTSRAPFCSKWGYCQVLRFKFTLKCKIKMFFPILIFLPRPTVKMGTMGEDLDVVAEVEAEVEVEVQVQVQVEGANASTPSLELTIHAGIKADQIKFNNNKNITIWHRGDPETLCGSGGPGFCYVHCNADCRDIKHTASTSRSLSLSIFLDYY